ncbi:MAG: c-type cytochrome [Nitrospiria bacterium]
MLERNETVCKLAFLFLVVSLSTFSAAIVRAEANPREGKHLYRHYCAVCHGESGKGNGINADMLGDVHPTDLTTPEFDKYSDEEIFEVIDGGGEAVDISYYMPPWGAVLTEGQMDSLVAYIRTLSEEKGTPLPETVRLPDLGVKGDGQCLVCHAKSTNLLRPIAPNIGHEGSKWRREALLKFLKQPEKLRPNGFMPFTKAKMPQFYFSDEEAEALADYLMTLKDEGISPNILKGWDPSDPEEIEKGLIFFEEDYACDGCHKRAPDGEGGIVGPELSDAFERIRPEWMFYWIKNPQAMRPDSPMPNFKIPDNDIRSILAYLASLSGKPSNTMSVSDTSPRPDRIAKGKRIVEGKNCGGCHRIDSYNSQADVE